MQLALMPVGLIDSFSMNDVRGGAKPLSCNERRRRHRLCFGRYAPLSLTPQPYTEEEHMPSTSARVIPLTQRLEWPRHGRSLDAEHVVLDAIRERRLLSVIYDGAVEPQSFAPYVLYFGEGQQVLLGGCEITKKRVRWRDLEIAHARRVELNDTTFTPGGLFKSGAAHYPYGIISAVDTQR
jgi:hypothetical protein